MSNSKQKGEEQENVNIKHKVYNGETKAISSEDNKEPLEKIEEKQKTISKDELLDKNYKWFIIHTLSGFEDKVKIKLEHLIKTEGYEQEIKKILIPREEVLDYKDGKKRVVKQKLYPGYIFIQMKDSEKNQKLIRSINGVTGFIGSGGKPVPVDDSEIIDIFNQMNKTATKPKVIFEIGDIVTIKSGAMADFTGTIQEVEADKGKVKVTVDLFGRLTPVELSFNQVEKI